MNKSLNYADIGLVPRVKSTIKSRQDPSTKVVHKKFTLDFPLIAAPMDTVCNGEMAGNLSKAGMVGIIHRFQTIEEQQKELLKALEIDNKNVGIAVGVTGDYKKRIEAMTKTLISRCSVYNENEKIWICFDTANGFSDYMEEAITWFKKNFSDHYIIIAGNVASKEGYAFLTNLGVDIVRLGIAGGSACTTGLVTGVGQGIVTTIEECVKNIHTYPHGRLVINKQRVGPLILADGGIRHSGDIAKALAVGADLVMVGSLLAGFDESPGVVKGVFPDSCEASKLDHGYKIFRGMASHTAGNIQNNLAGTNKQIIPEGIEHRVPYKGKLSCFLSLLTGGVRSAMSYFNGHDIKEFKKNASTVELTASSYASINPFIKEV